MSDATPSTTANLSHRQIMVVYSGLMAGLLVAALDQTIVATALPTIVGDLGGLSHLSWVVTAYLLTSTISVPLYGKISDLYGRKILFQSAIVIFVGGSMLSGHLSWRWVFYINVPVGAVALVITSTVLTLPYVRRQHAIDYLGSALIMAAATCLLFVTVWGGVTYPWGSVEVVGIGGAGVVLLGLFLLQERRAAEPLIPLRLWRNSVFSVASGLEFLVGFAMFGAIIFLPLYLQTVGHASATNSGVLILPLMAGLMVSSIFSGRIISRTGRYKVFPIAGTLVIALGLYLLSTMHVGTSRLQSSVYMVMLGLGIGMIIQVMVIAVQNAVEHKDLGTATATESFTRSMGGAFGVAIFGAVLTNRLAYNLRVLLPPGTNLHGVSANTLAASPAAIQKLPPAVRDAVIEALARSIHVVFLLAVPMTLAAFGVTWLLKENPLRETAHIGVEVAAGEPLVPEVEQRAAVEPR